MPAPTTVASCSPSASATSPPILFGQPAGLRYPLQAGFDGPLPEELLIELFDSVAFPDLPPLAPGTVTLGQGIENNLRTCQYCLWIPIDRSPELPLERAFFATEGTLTLTAVSDPFTPVLAGLTSEVVLREVTVDALGNTELIEGGRCVRVAPLSFDTTPTPGKECLSAEDCGNPFFEVCSPASNRCGPAECADFLFNCPIERQVCVKQYPNAPTSACYSDCDPSANAGCASSQTCVQQGFDPTFGLCKDAGHGALGAPCVAEDNSTSCARGLLCSPEGFCTQPCRYFTADPGCPDGTQCTLFGACRPLAGGGRGCVR